MGRRLASAIVVFAAGLGLGACSTTPSAPMPTPTASYSPSYPAPSALALAPLTGELVEPGSLDHPSLAAKVDNHVDARPQWGLERTDLVFEELVEGGITRYVAVWHSDVPKEIGPVRSIRPMDPDIISPLGGIVAYSGGQYRFVVAMQDTDVVNAIHGYSDMADIMYRTTERIAPHNVLVRARTLVGRHDELDPPRQQFAFADAAEAATAVVEGVPISSARIRFSAAAAPSWKWDGDKRVWLRSQISGVDRDRSGDRLTAVNVVVLRVPVSYGLGLPKTELIGEGRAWVLSEGRLIEAHWRKTSRSGLIRLTDGNGVVVRLAPGNSWIELMPSSGSFSSERA